MKLSVFAQSILPFRQLLIGFSGGLDSTVLLHHLMLLRDQQSNLQLRAIHIHHGLSPHADEWVVHCQSICMAWNIPLIVEYIMLQDKKKSSIEEKARKARYTAFASALLPGETLVTAQHLEDQCETLLLALKRGSGPTGLSAMPAISIFANNQQLRPLLNVSRNSLKAWADEHNLNWIEDESNQNDSYDRNFLRLRVVPLLIDRWPHFNNAVARSAQLCAEQESLLDEFLADELATAMFKDKTIAIAALQNKSSIHRAALLRRWLATHRTIMPSRDTLTRIWHEVALARKDANPVLHMNDEFEIRRYQGRLWWVPHLPIITNCILYWYNITESLALPYNIGQVSFQSDGHIRLPTKDERVTIRFQTKSRMLHIVGRHRGRKMKKIWQECNVPPWRRKTTPLLFYDEILIAAAGVFITQEGFTEDGGVQFIWQQNSK